MQTRRKHAGANKWSVGGRFLSRASCACYFFLVRAPIISAGRTGGFRETDRRKFLRWKVLGIIDVSTFLRRVCARARLVIKTRTRRTFVNETRLTRVSLFVCLCHSIYSVLIFSLRINKTITFKVRKIAKNRIFCVIFRATCERTLKALVGGGQASSRARNDVKREKRGGN